MDLVRQRETPNNTERFASKATLFQDELTTLQAENSEGLMAKTGAKYSWTNRTSAAVTAAPDTSESHSSLHSSLPESNNIPQQNAASAINNNNHTTVVEEKASLNGSRNSKRKFSLISPAKMKQGSQPPPVYKQYLSTPEDDPSSPSSSCDSSFHEPNKSTPDDNDEDNNLFEEESEEEDFEFPPRHERSVTSIKRRGRPPGSVTPIKRRGRPPRSVKFINRRGRPPGSVNSINPRGRPPRAPKKDVVRFHIPPDAFVRPNVPSLPDDVKVKTNQHSNSPTTSIITRQRDKVLQNRDKVLQNDTTPQQRYSPRRRIPCKVAARGPPPSWSNGHPSLQLSPQEVGAYARNEADDTQHERLKLPPPGRCDDEAMTSSPFKHVDAPIASDAATPPRNNLSPHINDDYYQHTSPLVHPSDSDAESTLSFRPLPSNPVAYKRSPSISVPSDRHDRHNVFRRSFRLRRIHQDTLETATQRQQQSQSFYDLPNFFLAHSEPRWSSATLDLVARAGPYLVSKIPRIPRFVQRLRATAAAFAHDDDNHYIMPRNQQKRKIQPCVMQRRDEEKRQQSPIPVNLEYETEEENGTRRWNELRA
jgi:hypothetical protein